ncbi:MAG: ExbD/TolR family protein [Gemmatimonadales bacterium]
MPQIVPRSGRTVLAEMNVLPMIDVLLVLVIAFFMAQQVRAVTDIQLPAASQSQGSPYQIVLTIAADGSLALNGHTVPDADLERTLSAIYRDRPSKVLFIKAAGERSYQDVIRLIDRAKGAGVQTVAMVPRGR